MATPTNNIDAAILLLMQAKSDIANPPVTYSGVTDTLPRPKPPLLILGGAPFQFADPTFGKRMVRVTDNTTFLGGGSAKVASNAHLAGWSADSKSFYVMGSGGEVKVFDVEPSTLNITLHTPYSAPYSQVEPQFSRTDPSILYTVGGPRAHTIRQWNLKDGQFANVLDLETLGLLNIAEETYIGGIVSGGNPEVVVAFFGGGGQDAHRYVVVTTPGSGNILKLLDTQTRGGYRLHSIAVDPTGRFVFLYPTNSLPHQVIIWDTSVDTLTPVLNLPTGHDCIGYDNKWVNAACCSGGVYDNMQWQTRDFVNGLETPTNLVVPPVPHEVYIAEHSNWNNAQPGKALPFFSATYRFYPKLNLTPWRAWDDEVLAVATDGSGTVTRLAHTRSNVVADGNPDGIWFDYQPVLNVSPNGKLLVFLSNWDKNLGLDPKALGHYRTDVFLLKVGD